MRSEVVSGGSNVPAITTVHAVRVKKRLAEESEGKREIRVVVRLTLGRRILSN